VIFSPYPEHYKNDYPLIELSNMELKYIVEEVKETGFSLEDKVYKTLLHDDYYNGGYIINFRKN